MPSVCPATLTSPTDLADLDAVTEFLPLIGDWIVAALERKLPPHLAVLWSYHGDLSRLDKSRGEGPIIRRDLDTGKAIQAKLPDAQTFLAKL